MNLSPLAFEPREVAPAGQPDQRQETGARSAPFQHPPDLAADSAQDAAGPKLQHVAEAVESYMHSLGVNLKFHIDERTDIVQVEVRDPDTDRLIRKIPADEMLDLAASIEKMLGLFLNTTL